MDGTTPRPSFSSPTDAQAPRTSTDKPKRVFPNAFTTPHDAILSDLQTPPFKLGATDFPNRPGSTRGDQVASPDIPESIGDVQLNVTPTEANLRSPTPPFTNLAGISRPSSTEILLNPFDGSALGVLLPRKEDGANAGDPFPSQVNLPGWLDAAPGGSSTVGSEAVWTHLSRILDLQSQISKQHVEMESIGAAKGSEAKRKGHKQSNNGLNEGIGGTSAAAYGLGPDDPPVPPSLRPRQRAMSTVSTLSSTSEPEGDEEGVNVPSEEAEMHRMREEEFAKLATQFEGRQEAINDIMGKLNELSKALTEFHGLPSPNIEFPASRNNSTAVTAPLASATSPKASMKEESKYLKPPLSQSTTAESNRTYEWTKQTSASSSSTLRPLQTTPKRDKNQPVILNPSPQRPVPQQKAVPTVLINSMDASSPTSLHDSPASTLGSLKLPPE